VYTADTSRTKIMKKSRLEENLKYFDVDDSQTMRKRNKENISTNISDIFAEAKSKINKPLDKSSMTKEYDKFCHPIVKTQRMDSLFNNISGISSNGNVSRIITEPNEISVTQVERKGKLNFSDNYCQESKLIKDFPELEKISRGFNHRAKTEIINLLEIPEEKKFDGILSRAMQKTPKHDKSNEIMKKIQDLKIGKNIPPIPKGPLHTNISHTESLKRRMKMEIRKI
jgi:hypothetical protein